MNVCYDINPLSISVSWKEMLLFLYSWGVFFEGLCQLPNQQARVKKSGLFVATVKVSVKAFDALLFCTLDQDSKSDKYTNCISGQICCSILQSYSQNSLFYYPTFDEHVASSIHSGLVFLKMQKSKKVDNLAHRNLPWHPKLEWEQAVTVKWMVS